MIACKRMETKAINEQDEASQSSMETQQNSEPRLDDQQLDLSDEEQQNEIIEPMETDDYYHMPLTPETIADEHEISPIRESKALGDRMSLVQQYLHTFIAPTRSMNTIPEGILIRNVSNQDVESIESDKDDIMGPINNNNNNSDMDEGNNNEGEENWRSEGTITFKVDKISELGSERVFSQPVIVRYMPWRILIMVSYDKRNKNSKNMAVFVECSNESTTAWACNAYVGVKLLSFKEDVAPIFRDMEHLYTPAENDWGYSNFIDWNDLFDPEKGFVQNDSIILEAYIKADPPRGNAFAAKKCTGYVGLKNQGATCYMNSLLQALYFTNEFRKAVYKIPTEADNPTNSIALNIQKVFYNMQSSEKSVGTLKLAKSFGWETMDLVMQHDVQEFLRLLLDRLEDRMKGTCVEGTIPRIFEGEMSSYIKCKDIDFESRRVETFYDVQLNIKNNKDIYAAFDDYIRPEILDGDNKYDAGPYGLQVAEKGLIFTKFPPVLYLQLVRTQYDPVYNRNFKLMDYFEFYDKIDLDRYLAKPEPTPAHYKLHSVLVHAGLEAQAGHYVAYISPNADGIWFKFDDEIVTRACRSEAIQKNFGGKDTGVNASCAYMLIYIRISALQRILSEVHPSDIPSELLERFKQDKRACMLKKKENSGPPKVVVNIFLEDTLEQHHFSDLLDWEEADFRVFKLKPEQTVKELSDIIATSFVIKDHRRFRFWPILVHMEVSRPIYFNKELDSNSPLSSLTDPRDPLPIFLELAPPGTKDPLPLFNDKEHLLIFFKYYDPHIQRLMYLGFKQYSISTTLAELVLYVNKQLGLDPNFTGFVIYEEIAHFKLQRFISLSDKLGDILFRPLSEICGYVLIFQKETYDDMNELEIPTVEKFYEFLPYRAEVTFFDKMDPGDIYGFALELSYRETYTEMAEKVGKHLNIDPKLIQFFSVKNEDIPYLPFRYNSVRNFNLGELLAYNKPNVNKLFYQKLDFDVTNIEAKTQYKFLWLARNYSDQKEFLVYGDKKDTVKALKDDLEKQLVRKGLPAKNLRILEVSNSKIRQIHKNDTPLSEFPNFPHSVAIEHTFYRVEETPEDHLNVLEDEMLIPVFHFRNDTTNAFGTPFIIKIRQGETFLSIRERIQKHLRCTGTEPDSYKILFFSMSGATYLTVDTDTIELKWFCNPYPSFGIEHGDKIRTKLPISINLEKTLRLCAAKCPNRVS